MKGGRVEERDGRLYLPKLKRNIASLWPDDRGRRPPRWKRSSTPILSELRPGRVYSYPHVGHTGQQLDRWHLNGFPKRQASQQIADFANKTFCRRNDNWPGAGKARGRCLKCTTLSHLLVQQRGNGHRQGRQTFFGFRVRISRAMF
jgi:hypothetical protein